MGALQNRTVEVMREIKIHENKNLFVCVSPLCPYELDMFMLMRLIFLIHCIC